MVAFVGLVAMLEAVWLVWFSDSLSQLMILATGIFAYYRCRDNVTPKKYVIPELEGLNVRSFCEHIKRSCDGDEHRFGSTHVSSVERCPGSTIGTL